MLAYSGPVTARALAMRTWRSAFSAITAMPLLFVALLLLQAVLAAAVVLVPGMQSWLVRPKPQDITVLLTLKHIASRGLTLMLNGLVAAPLAVAVHRHILLGKRGAPFAPSRNLFFWMVALQLFFLAAFSFSLLASSVAFVRGLIDFIIFIGLIVVVYHLAVMFPAIAIEVPAKSAEARIDQSWSLMQGRFWLWLRLILLTLLPFIVIALVLMVLAPHKQPPGPGAVQAAAGAAKAVAKAPAHAALLATAIVGGVIQVMLAALLSAMTSWLYAAIRR